MSLHERLGAIQRQLSGKPTKLSQRESRFKKQEEEIQDRVRNSYDFLRTFGDILAQPPFAALPPFEGVLELGTDIEPINWEAMPESLKNCFEPEFEFQPEEITSFRLTCTDEPQDGTRQMKITLDRNSSWWSKINVEMLVQEYYTGPSVRAFCCGDQAQVREAREAMAFINNFPEEATHAKLMLARSQHELMIAEEIFGFACSELERQFGFPTPNLS